MLHSLSPAEKNYGISEVEVLVIVKGIKKFAYYLACTNFTVVTDHHALQFLQSKKSSDLRGRLARWAPLLQQHDFTIVYRPGKVNIGPDALSRYPVSSPSASSLLCSLATPDLVSVQVTDRFCQDIRGKSPFPASFSDESGVLFFEVRPVLPECLKEAFNLLHSNTTAGHLGVSRTLQRFTTSFRNVPGGHDLYYHGSFKRVQSNISG
ncbi:hypothetical protein RMCBS344292_06348 [Rhizopus microsporus]|nr:hypothetical protein RMCBS344292_06348 [Rhizopus microsporus]